MARRPSFISRTIPGAATLWIGLAAWTANIVACGSSPGSSSPAIPDASTSDLSDASLAGDGPAESGGEDSRVGPIIGSPCAGSGTCPSYTYWSGRAGVLGMCLAAWPNGGACTFSCGENFSGAWPDGGPCPPVGDAVCVAYRGTPYCVPPCEPGNVCARPGYVCVAGGCVPATVETDASDDGSDSSDSTTATSGDATAE